MPTERDYINAAKKTPSARSSEEQAMVDRGSNMQSVRNADHAAREQERIYGK